MASRSAAFTRKRTRKPRRAAELGIDDDLYAQLLESQGGVCALCGGTPKRLRKNGTPYRLHVDHDHRSGSVRGLLCFPCNRKLPRGVTREWLLRAAEYVG